LGQRPDTALRVATRYNAGKLPREDLGSVIEAVRAHATPELQAAMQAMLKDKLLAAPTGEEARRLRDYVGRHGNPARGKAIYLDAKKGGCTTCHRMEGVGGSVRPDLTRVWETLSFDKRVESLLEPSQEIKEGFATYKVATKNGQVLTGLLVESTPEAVTLKDTQGREVKVPAVEIEEKGNDPVSLMPVGVVGHLSFAELADLLAFLGDRAAQESLRNSKP
jgi:putative heme-binding domain-containing protein